MAQFRNQADIEYAVMLAILNFHTEFMKSNYAHVQVRIADDVIDAMLIRHSIIPAEARLAQTEEGRALLRRVHEAMFLSCQEVLRARIEPVVGKRVRAMVTSLDPVSGRITIVISLQTGLAPTTPERTSDDREQADVQRSAPVANRTV